MKNSILLLFLVITLVPQLHSQTIEWTKTYPTKMPVAVSSITPTADGGFAILGWIGVPVEPGFYHQDFYLIRLDSKGDTLWTKTYGFGDNDAGASVIQLNDGGFLLSGNTNSIGAKIPMTLVFRTDRDGKELWHKTLAGLGGSACRFSSKTSDGKIVLGGYTWTSIGSEPYASHTAWIVKMDTLANILWVSGWDPSDSTPAPWTDAIGIRPLPDGQVMVKIDSSGHRLPKKIIFKVIDSSGIPLNRYIYSLDQKWSNDTLATLGDGSALTIQPFLTLPPYNSGLFENLNHGSNYDQNGSFTITKRHKVEAPISDSCEYLQKIAEAPPLVERDVIRMAQAPDGRIWAVHRKGFMTKIGPNWFEYEAENSGLPSNQVTGVAIDNKNNKWITTADAGLTKFNDTTWTVFNKSNSPLPSDSLNDVATDTLDNVWISVGVAKQWVRFNGQSTWTLVPKTFPDIHLRDKYGDIWSVRDTTLIFHGTGEDSILVRGPISTEYIYSITSDGSGGILLNTPTTILKWDNCKDRPRPEVQAFPVLGMDSVGSIIVAWEGSGAWENTGIFAQRYTAQGQKIGARIRVDVTGMGVASKPDLSVDKSGRFVIAWKSGTGLLMRKYFSDGSPNGNRVKVAPYLNQDWLAPRLYGYSIALGETGSIFVSMALRQIIGSESGTLGGNKFNFTDTTINIPFTIYDYLSGYCMPLTSQARALPTGGFSVIYDIDNIMSKCGGDKINVTTFPVNLTNPSTTTIGKGRNPGFEIASNGTIATVFNSEIQFFNSDMSRFPGLVANTSFGGLNKLATNSTSFFLSAAVYDDSVYGDLFKNGNPIFKRIPLGPTQKQQFDIGLNTASEAVLAYVENDIVKIRFLDVLHPTEIKSGLNLDRPTTLRLSNRQLFLKLSHAQSIQLDLLTPQGVLAQRLFDGNQEAGISSFSLTGFLPGLYLLRMTTPGKPVHLSKAMLFP